MRENKEKDIRLQAGLLWIMLPHRYRKDMARHLSLDEMERLNDLGGRHRSLELSRKRKVENSLLKNARLEHGALPLLFTGLMAVLTGGLFVWHLVLYPSLGENLRLALFTPLALGTLSFLALRLVPAYRLRMLFRLEIGAAKAMFFVAAMIGTMWVLASIRMENQGASIFRPTGLHLLILLLGAVSAPLLEEVFFRELLPGMFPGGADGFTGHGVSALLFSVAHLPDSLYMGFLYLLAGAFLSMIRIYTGGLVYPFVAHAVANATLLLLSAM